MRRWIGLALGIVLVGGGAVWAVEGPVAVSPGSAEGVSQVESRCPGFDWAGAAEANSFELVVYRVGEEGEEPEPVLRQTIPGGANGWTPSLDRCLERGGRYGWTVRALGQDGDSEWSRPSLFEVAPGPSEEELAEALRVVKEYFSPGSPTSTPAVLQVTLDGIPGSGATASSPSPQSHAGGSIVVNGELVLSGRERKSNSLPLTVPPGTVVQAIQGCPAGKVVVGGGGSSNATGVRSIASFPVSDSVWRVDWINVTGQQLAATLTTFAICAHE